MNLLMTAMVIVMETDPYWKFPLLHLNSEQKVMKQTVNLHLPVSIATTCYSFHWGYWIGRFGCAASLLTESFIGTWTNWRDLYAATK